MPELPEVETIRMGLLSRIVGRRIIDAHVWGARIARAQTGGASALENQMIGRRIDALARRGKFLWAELDSGQALVFHLGMSGQLRIFEGEPMPRSTHEHARMDFEGGGSLSFFDQRTFGRLEVASFVDTADGEIAGWGSERRAIPASAAHIARDPLDPAFDAAIVVKRIRASQSPIKNLLLNQSLVSGIGNIYADEALFTAGVHGRRMGKNLRVYEVENLLAAAAQIMRSAIEVGGTSFDALYVNAEGDPGYFSRSLRVYGRDGEACVRCGTTIRRVAIQGRSHHFCPLCQPRSKPGVTDY
ncbi:MAG: bifunctional DNA-formamidopyrimidine glycosylase/DNA-(apurinic or apyrimidinic site) lyase [Actinomycetaceae bacterium]|nr:bifunctional DNA-formamidopyrimidine glycosylase/DNA-(apurinic or apyrimidinic site) lyase [Actinomycetaceae bacterium]